MFEFDIDWDEHSGTCEDVHVFGFIDPPYFSVQYMFPVEWCTIFFYVDSQFCFGFVRLVL